MHKSETSWTGAYKSWITSLATNKEIESHAENDCAVDCISLSSAVSSRTQGQYALSIVNVSHETFEIKTTSLLTTFQSESLLSIVATELLMNNCHSPVVIETDVADEEIHAVNCDVALFLNQYVILFMK